MLKTLKIFENSKVFEKIEEFYSSIFYIFFIGIITLFSCIFGLEIYCYYLYLIVGLIIPSLCCKDLKSIIAPFIFGYFTVSLKNNEGEAGRTLFSYPFLYHFYVIFSLILVFFIVRIAFLIKNKEYKEPPRMLIGFFVLLISFFIGGIFTPYFDITASAYGLSVVASMLVPYLLIYYLVDKKSANPQYFAQIFLILGIVLTIQTLSCYLGNIDAIKNNTFNAARYVRTGWGIKNNIGGMIVLALPFSIYLAIKNKYAPLYISLNIITFLGVILTQSRGAIVCSFGVEFLAYIYFFIKRREKYLSSIFTILGFIVFFVILGFIFSDKVKSILSTLYNTIKNLSWSNLLSGRDYLYNFGIDNFVQNPLFGEGFYKVPPKESVPDYFYGTFIPPRYHNTYIQLLSSTGIIGFIAYLYHRIETLNLHFRFRSIEKDTNILFFIGYIAISLGDCHFFNIGPGLLYGIVLAFSEFYDLNNNKVEEFRENKIKNIMKFSRKY